MKVTQEIKPTRTLRDACEAIMARIDTDLNDEQMVTFFAAVREKYHLPAAPANEL
jgi:hypothetical protein